MQHDAMSKFIQDSVFELEDAPDASATRVRSDDESDAPVESARAVNVAVDEIDRLAQDQDELRAMPDVEDGFRDGATLADDALIESSSEPLGAQRASAAEMDAIWAAAEPRRQSRYFDPVDLRIKCFACGKGGHYSSACPAPKLVACQLCGRAEGHDAARCPQEVCYRCFQPGHFIAKCSHERVPRPGWCLRCGSTEHRDSICTVELGTAEFNELHQQTSCIACNKVGHINCGRTPSRRSLQDKCFCGNCGLHGHTSSRCREPTFEDSMQRYGMRVSDAVHANHSFRSSASTSNLNCFKCGGTGHFARDCTRGGGGSGGKRAFRAAEFVADHSDDDAGQASGDMMFSVTLNDNGKRKVMDQTLAPWSPERKQQKLQASQSTGANKKASKPTISCFRCQQSGHMARDCPRGQAASASKASQASHTKKSNRIEYDGHSDDDAQFYLSRDSMKNKDAKKAAATAFQSRHEREKLDQNYKQFTPQSKHGAHQNKPGPHCGSQHGSSGGGGFKGRRK